MVSTNSNSLQVSIVAAEVGNGFDVHKLTSGCSLTSLSSLKLYNTLSCLNGKFSSSADSARFLTQPCWVANPCGFGCIVFQYLNNTENQGP